MIPHALLQRSRLVLAMFWLALLASLTLSGQQVATGSIEGRIFNPTTRDYVGNAEVRLLSTGEVTYTESDGIFRFPSVPVGDASVMVTYTGYETMTLHYKVVAGQTATQEVNLISTAANKKTADDGTVMLEAFTVSSEREGNAKAIMAQRRNMDITTSVSSDLFGDVADGNVGEFLKYLPGVDLDYVESEARGPRLGGMDAQYVGVSFDGLRLASADANRTGDASRATSFEGFSISAIESIEIYYTTSPEGSADSPAGTINMRSRRAFDTKGRRISFNSSLNFNTEEFTWRQTVGPDDRWHYKWKPNGTLTVSDSWNFGGKKLGVVLSGSRANSYTEQYNFAYDYNNNPQANDSRPLVIRQIDIKDGPKWIFKDSFSLNTDFQLSPRLVLSLTSLYTFTEGEFHNRNFTWVAANNNANNNNGRRTVEGDGLLTVIANRTTSNTVPTLNNGGGSEAKRTWTRLLAPKFEYKTKSWVFDGVISKSKSVNDYNALGNGFSSGEGQGVPSSWIATRPSVDSHQWTIRQTGGPDWYDPYQWGSNSTDNRAGGTRANDSGRTFSTEIWDAGLNARWVTPIRRFPTVVKVGAKWNEEARDHMNTADWEMYSYVGPGGNRIFRYNPTTGLPEFRDTASGFNGFSSWANVGPQYISPHPFDTGTTNGLTVFNINGTQGMPPRVNRNAISQLYNEHPEWFVRTGNLDNYYNAFIANKRDVKQTVTSGYFQADIKFGPKLSVRTGLRVEKTVNAFREWDPKTRAEILAAGYGYSTSTNRSTTFEGLHYQFMSNPRVTRESDYIDLFPSVTAKYQIRKNLEFQAGYNYSIGRPPIDNLTGVYVINETSQLITAPNARLEPEYHKKYQARLAWYLEPSGQFSVAVSQIDTTNMRASYDYTIDDFGIDDPDLIGYFVRSTINVPGERTTRSMDITYRQTLAFLPKAFRGTTLSANYSRAYVQQFRRNGTAPHRVSGGINYTYNRFSGSLNGSWTDDKPWSNEFRWQRHITQFDLSLNWKLSNNLWLYIQGRNITKEPVTWYERPRGAEDFTNGHLRQYQYYGANWVFGVRGNF